MDAEPLKWVYEPIVKWPRQLTAKRRRSPFQADWNNTARLLRYELGKVDARSVVLQLAIKRDAIRKEGALREDARMIHPGVIVAFQSTHGPLQMPCDTFLDWRHNVRAVALHLENLRHASLYGVGRHGEQYRGWRALPEGPTIVPAMTAGEAAAFVCQHAMEADPIAVVREAAAFSLAYKQAAKQLHPDAAGEAAPNDAAWNQLQEAARVLKQLHGLA